MAPLNGHFATKRMCDFGFNATYTCPKPSAKTLNKRLTTRCLEFNEAIELSPTHHNPYGHSISLDVDERAELHAVENQSMFIAQVFLVVLLLVGIFLLRKQDLI